MKKLLFIIFALCIVSMLTACGKPPTVQSDFTAAFTVSDCGVDYAGRLQKGSDDMTITMTAPYTVEGIEFVYGNDTLSIRCGDHETKANADYLNASGVPSALHNALAYLSQATYIDSQDGKDHFTLPTPYGDAELTAEDGLPSSLIEPHSGMEFCFSEQCVNE